MGQPAGDVLVVGAGGHALVVIDVLRSVGATVAGCVSDDGLAGADLGPAGCAMLGTTGDVPGLIASGLGDVFVAVGDNRARWRIGGDVRAAGGRMVTAVSPDAVVSPSAELDDGVLVMPGAVVNAQARIGTGVIVNTAATVDHECLIGAFAHIAPRAVLAGRVTIGIGTLVGVGACVTPQRCVGSWAVVGAGAVVVRDVPDDVTVAGVPASTGYGSAAG